MTAPPDDTTTALHAVIAELRAERDAALSEKATLVETLALRNSEFGERIEHQAATIDVLKAMSASPGDAQPVFDLIARQAANQCNVPTAAVATFDGTMMHLAAENGLGDAYVAQFPRPVGLDFSMGRAVLTRQVDQVEDITAYPGHSFVGVLGNWSVMAVPILRDGQPLGAITIGRPAMGPFSDSQVALLKTFAEQAVIAITSAETYRALQARTTDLQQSLEYQTATSGVLNVISRSTFDLHPVLSTVTETAARLCVADQAALFRHEGGTLYLAANWGFPPEYEARMNEIGRAPVGAAAQTIAHRAIIERRVIHIPDVAAVPGYPDAPIRLGRQRTSLGVPLLREGEPVGLILLARQRVEPFTDRQINLVRTFADQAVIAIENTRLITEQREALERQTATAEVLQVINSSPGDLAPVFDTMLERALHLCQSAFGVLATYDGEVFHHVAVRGVTPELADFMRKPLSPVPGMALHRVLEGEDVVHTVDIVDDDAYQRGIPARRMLADLGGARTQLLVALRKDDVLLGVLNIFRQEVRPFSDRQVALLQNFAAQAVIAMENARLLTEQREALERQTATAEVLQAINGNPGDLTPVFDAILKKAHSLIGGVIGALVLYEGPQFRAVATNGFSEQHDAMVRQLHGPTPGHMELLAGARFKHYHDLRSIKNHQHDVVTRSHVENNNARTALWVPLRKDGRLLGLISVYGLEVRPFVEKEITLLENFAAQAVIAMENARLLTEQREALEQQTATAEVLQVINSSPGDLVPVFDALLEKALRLCEAAFGSLATYDGAYFHAVAMRGVAPGYAASLNRPLPPFPAGTGRLVAGESVVQIADITATDDYRRGIEHVRASADQGGMRTALFVALRKDDTLLGRITIFRQEVRPFSDKQIALLRNFAAQAVIAMENARLINETREALEQQTATAEVLRVISSSPADVQPTFDAIATAGVKLCDAANGAVFRFDGSLIHFVAQHGMTTAQFDTLRDIFPLAPSRSSITARAIMSREVVHAPDLAADPEFDHPSLIETVGRGSVSVPMLRDGEPIGAITITRPETRSFTGKQISLLKIFADQAVIAIENARLITEQRDALEQQTATAEVLQVINASPGDLAPVFEAMLEKAVALCGAAFGILLTYDGERFHHGAFRSIPAAYVEYMREHPPSYGPENAPGRLALGERLVHTLDITDTDAYRSGDPNRRAIADLAGARTLVAVALRKEGALVGAIVVFRQEVRAFSDKQIALLENFAAQGVIAMENARLLNEQREALEQQTATAEVLQVINASPGDLSPVFDALLERAMRLCGAAFGSLYTYDGERFLSAAQRGVPSAYAAFRAGHPPTPVQGSGIATLVETRKPVHALDVAASELYRAGHPSMRAMVELGGVRTSLIVPLLKDDALLGFISVYRQEVRAYSDKQITLLESFAAQAVIAMENARLLTELRQRTEELARRNSEYGERIEQQSATIDVLEAMSASSGDAQPVFQVIVERARAFCNADNANLALVDGDVLHVQATTINQATENALYMAQFPRPVDSTSMFGRAILARDAVQTPDVSADPLHFQRTMSGGATPRPLGLVAVPLLRAGAPIGAIVLARNTPGEFSATQVELLRTFAEQAVIAISSADTFKELQRRTADLTRSVAELQALEEVLRAVNSSLELETVLSTIISRAVQLSDADEGTIYEYDVSEQVFVPKSAFGMSAERVVALRERRIKLGETHLGRSAILRAPVYVKDVQQDPSVPNAGDVLPGIHAVLAVPLLRNDTVIGGLVIRRRTEKGFAETIITLMQTFSSQAVLAIENARLFQEAGRARTAAEAALVDLRRAQDRLVQSEKMASLGQLTAGIAHEIKNPLNFVNNFATLSVDLLDELKQTAAPGFAMLDEGRRAEIDDLTRTLSGNLEKINEHGNRADAIVRSMLEHSRGSSGERRSVNLNALVDEALNLAYHGARAQDQSFNITLQRDLGEGIAPITLVPQDMTRVLLNLFSNGFYATRRRHGIEAALGFEPTLSVATRELGDAVEIRVRDNGIGIPEEVKDKLFQPFFTTKPTGEGTGLGLSISYDVVVQQHGGSIAVDSKVGEFSEFVVTLPRQLAGNERVNA